MRNPFALTGAIGDDTPSQIFGYRIYLLALSATWVCTPWRQLIKH